MAHTGRAFDARPLPGILALACVASSVGCGSDSTEAPIPDPGLPPVIETPALACASIDGGCACSAAPGVDSGVVDASAALCGDKVAPGASCCAGVDYPFAGECVCSGLPCADGGIAIPSCSDPPTFIDAGACDPAECSGSSCAGGYCCTSSCQAGACQSTCS